MKMISATIAMAMKKMARTRCRRELTLPRSCNRMTACLVLFSIFCLVDAFAQDPLYLSSSSSSSSSLIYPPKPTAILASYRQQRLQQHPPWRTATGAAASRRADQQRQSYDRYNPSYRRAQEYAAHYLDYDKQVKNDGRALFWQVSLKSRRPGSGMSITSKLVFLNVVAFVIQSINPRFTAWGVKRSDLILQGRELYRLLTPVFLHGNIGHIFTNMYSLNRMGNDLERFFGSARYLTTYLMAGIAGNVCSAFMSPNPALGASGAVFGVLGAYTTFLLRHEWLLSSAGEDMSSRLMQTAALNIVLGFVNPAIDNWGHIGGALGGAVMAYWIGPRLYWTEIPPDDQQSVLLSLPQNRGYSKDYLGSSSRLLVDRPMIRFPPNWLEAMPSRVQGKLDRFLKRPGRRQQPLYRSSSHDDEDNDNNDDDSSAPAAAPWRSNQGPPRRPRPNLPDRSIKPGKVD
jgi:membrane associated rhomboid family serine protease